MQKLLCVCFLLALNCAAATDEWIIRLRPETAHRFVTANGRRAQSAPAIYGSPSRWLIPDSELGTRARKFGNDRIVVADISHSPLFPGLRGNAGERNLALAGLRHLLAADVDVIQLNAPLYIAQNAAVDSAPNDPLLNQQWYLGAIGQAYPVTQSQISVISESEAIKVVIMDTGIAPVPDLLANIDTADSKDFSGSGNALADPGTSGVSSEISFGHGTAVAGLIGAVCNNGIGICGINSHVSLVSYRIFGVQTNADGTTGLRGSEANVLAAFAALLDLPGKFVVNCSFVVGSGDDPLLTAAVKAIEDKGLVVAGAGNTGDATSLNPCGLGLANVVCPTATDQTGKLPGWATYGQQVNIAAPGSQMVSTGNDGNYYPFSGTSFSTPVTSGVVTVVWPSAASLSPAEMIQALLNGASFNPNLLGKIAAPRQVSVPGSLAAAERMVLGGPTMSVSAIVSLWSGQPDLAWGGVVSIFGNNLGDSTAIAADYPLPILLGNVSVFLDATPMPLMYASPGQLNCQLPFYDGSGNSSHLITVARYDGQGNMVDSQYVNNVNLVPANPGILTDQSGQPVMQNDTDNGQLVLFAAGLGPTSPGLTAGMPGKGSELATIPIRFQLDGKYVQVNAVASALAAGLYEIRVQQPAIAPQQIIVSFSVGDSWKSFTF
ncbi:MAG: S8 family serine peptidase [Candidatus Doudnabacteria bacterium]|nr:S8 family serine peptidase [Candidatus Doudnabacteria bacterium]